MKILRPLPGGHIVVTFWSSEEDPEGCMMFLGGAVQQVYALAAVETAVGQPPEVGLLEMHFPLFQYFSQLNAEKQIAEHDYAIIGNGRELVVVAQQGGAHRQPAEVIEQFDALRKTIDSPGAEAELRTALIR